MMLQAGVARTDLTPWWGIELTGWGYYMERRWQTVHDRLHATALVVNDGQKLAAVIALDLMVIDEQFTQLTRDRIAAETGLAPAAIMLTCSHSHNAPAAGGLRGVGACDPEYENWASRQAATAAILAWRQQVPVSLRTGHVDLPDLTFNRTRAEGVVDPRLTMASFDRDDGSPLAIMANFGAHPTVWTELMPFAVTRDIPGAVCDRLEAAYPGSHALYIQGACGDTNFHRDFATADRCQEPADRLAAAAVTCLSRATLKTTPLVNFTHARAQLPTRRWTREEIERDRSEAVRRLRDHDFTGWRETIGRSMTNRPDDMVRRHGGDEEQAVRAMCRFHLEWTELMLQDWESRPEFLETEAQALRIGELCLIANSSEFFAPFARRLRAATPAAELMLACYANGRIGYLPDEHDVAMKSYAGYQSPKYCNQFPFTPESGPALCTELERLMATLYRE